MLQKRLYPPSLVWCKRARVVDVCNLATNERMRPRVYGPTVSRPLCRCHGVIRFISWLHTQRDKYRFVTSLARYISFRNVEHVPQLLWDDHNRFVDALKLNVVAGARNFRADNRAVERYSQLATITSWLHNRMQRRCAPEVTSIFTAFGLHNAPARIRTFNKSLSSRFSLRGEQSSKLFACGIFRM